MKAAYLLLVFVAIQHTANASVFAEGYSSPEPGSSSKIYFRAFTIYTAQDACDKSPKPSDLRISPNPFRMRVGDRIHHSGLNVRPSDFVIEAYDEHGMFLPSVPIIVNIIDTNNVTASRSDWDYFEAINEGEAKLTASWLCSTTDGHVIPPFPDTFTRRI